jgi:hypothetical protein
VGVVVKSVIVLGSVYVAIFGSEMSGARLPPAATATLCTAAAASGTPRLSPVSATACAETLSAEAREALRARFASEPVRLDDRSARAEQTLTAADLAYPWVGPTVSPKRSAAKKARVASRARME